MNTNYCWNKKRQTLQEERNFFQHFRVIFWNIFEMKMKTNFILNIYFGKIFWLHYIFLKNYKKITTYSKLYELGKSIYSRKQKKKKLPTTTNNYIHNIISFRSILEVYQMTFLHSTGQLLSHFKYYWNLK